MPSISMCTTGPTVPWPWDWQPRYNKKNEERKNEKEPVVETAVDRSFQYLKSGGEAFDADDYYHALEYCKRAVSSGLSEPIGAYDIIAASYAHLGDPENAIVYFKKVLEIDKEYRQAYISLANCYCEIKEYMLALSNFKKAYDLDKSDTDCLLSIAHCLYLLKDFNAAEKTLNDALYKCENHAQTDKFNHGLFLVCLGKGDEFRDNKEYRKAVELYQKALAMPSLSKEEIANTHIAAGGCLAALGDYHEAKKNLESAFRYVPTNIPLLLGLAHIHIRLWEIEKAAYCYDKYLQYVIQNDEHERDTFNSVNALVKSLKNIKLKNYLAALNEVEKITNARNDLFETREILAPLILLKMERYEEIIARVKHLVSDPDISSTSLVCLGIAYCKLGKFELALQYLLNGEKNGYKHSGLNGWAYRGEACFGLQQYKDALTAYQKAMTFNGPREFTEFEEDYFAYRIQKCRELLAEKERKSPSHITIQGDHNPVNIGGIQATDDAVINRSHVSSADIQDKYCSQCGAPLKPKAKFCSKCGSKVE